MALVVGRRTIEDAEASRAQRGGTGGKQLAREAGSQAQSRSPQEDRHCRLILGVGSVTEGSDGDV